MDRRKEKLNKPIHPEKYRMAWCPACKGTGRFPDKDGKVKVCTLCGGFGWVKKESTQT